MLPKHPSDWCELSAGTAAFLRRSVPRLNSASPDSCWSSSLPRRDLPRRSPGMLPVATRISYLRVSVRKADKGRTRRHWVYVPTLLLQLCDARVVVVLPMPWVDFLSIGAHQALFPPDRYASRLRKPSIERRRLWLVCGVLSLAGLVERRLTVATFGVLEGDAALGLGGVFGEGCTPRDKARLGLVRRGGGLWSWGPGRTRRTLPSVIHGCRGPSRE